MVYVGEFCANFVVYRFCEVLSYKKWTLTIFSNKMLPIPAIVYFINDPDSQRSGCGIVKGTYFVKSVPNFQVGGSAHVTPKPLTIGVIYEVNHSWYG